MEKLKEILNKLKGHKLVALAIANPYYLLVAAAVLITVFTIIRVYYLNLPSENEQNLQNLNNQSTEQQADTTVKEQQLPEAERKVRDADTAVKDTTKKANEARNANTTNSNYNDANAARCRAYPESPECSKR